MFSKCLSVLTTLNTRRMFDAAENSYQNVIYVLCVLKGCQSTGGKCLRKRALENNYFVYFNMDSYF